PLPAHSPFCCPAFTQSIRATDATGTTGAIAATTPAAMRHAGPVAHLTTAELALIPAATALAGVALGIAANSYAGRQRQRRAARDQRDQAIAELLTATVDLVSGIGALRAAYLKQGGWRHYVRAGAIIIAAAGEVLGPGGTLSTEILRDWHRIAPGF